MDIIDIMLARAMTPQGQTETYVSIANAAAAKAEKAKSDAEDAVATVEAAASTIEETQEAADTLLATAQEALETAQAAQINTLDTEDVDAEIKKFTISYSKITSNPNDYYTNLHLSYPDGTGGTIDNIVQLAKSTGSSETMGMTQKAITDALDAKADASTAATKTYVDQKVAQSGGGSGAVITFDVDDAGKLVMVDDNGNLAPAEITETELIDALLQTGAYTSKTALGLDIDYANKNIQRIQSAVDLTMGSDFDQYTMYGGRMRCNVADDGTINAFYGDSTYRDDGSNGQVMIYQPKFYYQRSILNTSNLTNGTAILHEQLIISSRKLPGFKVAPIFKSGNEELDYILLSAYEGTISNNKLVSIANNKPAGNLTIAEAEAKASAHGTGWHIESLAAVATNQMLEMVEFGSMNGQVSLESGISNISEVQNINCSSITGSTIDLGNATGHATQTTNEKSGSTTLETEAGKRAISYRGMENPWGNMWKMICDVNIKGDGQSQGGALYICTDGNYTPGTVGNNYDSIGFNLPAVYGWVSAMGKAKDEYDWVYLPIECSNVANSLLPVGDNLWVTAHTSENKILAVGGSYALQENNGPFYYAADRNVSESARPNYGARLMFIPTINNIYNANIEKWNIKMGG